MKSMFALVALAGALTLGACGKDKTADTAAAEKNAPAAATANDAKIVRVSVPTMQCESCVKTITGAVKKVEGVENVDVKLDQKSVFVTVSDRTPQRVSEIESAIVNAGYSTDAKARDAAAYDKLPTCCKDGGGEHKN